MNFNGKVVLLSDDHPITFIKLGIELLKSNREKNQFTGLVLILEAFREERLQKISVPFPDELFNLLPKHLGHPDPTNRELTLMIIGKLAKKSEPYTQKSLHHLYQHAPRSEKEAIIILKNLSRIRHPLEANKIRTIFKKYNTNLEIIRLGFEALNVNANEWKKTPYEYHEQLLMLSSILTMPDEKLRAKAITIIQTMGSAAKTCQKELVELYFKTNSAKEMFQIVLALLKIDPENQKKYPEIFDSITSTLRQAQRKYTFHHTIGDRITTVLT